MRFFFCFLIATLVIGQWLGCEQASADNKAVIKSASEHDYPPFGIFSHRNDLADKTVDAYTQPIRLLEAGE